MVSRFRAMDLQVNIYVTTDSFEIYWRDVDIKTRYMDKFSMRTGCFENYSDEGVNNENYYPTIR